MRKIESKKFEEYRQVIIKNLPNHNGEFCDVEMYYDPEGGEYKKGELLLIDEAEPSVRIYTTSSSHPITEDSIEKHYAQEFAKMMFLNLVAKKLTHDDIAGYFLNIIRLAHNDVCVRNLPDRIEISYHSIQLMPKALMFTVVPDKINFVVLKDNVPYESINFSWLENKKTYYSKYSEGNVVNYKSMIGYLSCEPAFSHSTKLYMAAFGGAIKSVTAIVGALTSEEKTIAFGLKSRLVNIPYSRGKAYEDLLNEIVHFIFSNCYDDIKMHVQVPNEGRLRIRDIIIDNREPQNSFLSYLRSNGVHYILMDAKNYKKPLKSNEVDTFIGYIGENKRFGGFGVILSRKGASKNLVKQQIKKLNESVELIILEESEIMDMIDLRALDRDPMSILKEKLMRLHLQQ